MLPTATAAAEARREHRISRKAVPRGSTKPETSPTPGVDDTPYIQFAIDQLTRDEELLGHSRDPSGSPELTPVSPISSRGSMRRAGAGTHPAQQPLSRGEEIHAGAATTAAVAARSASVSPLSAEDTMGRPRANLVPAMPPPESNRYPPLNYVPSSLRLPAILALVLACLLLMGLVILAMVWDAKYDGLWDYDGVGTGKYFLAEYLPQILAVVILIWLHIVMATVQRILPFALLASHANNASMPMSPAMGTTSANVVSKAEKDVGTDIISNVPMYTTHYFLPNTSLIRKDEPALTFASFITWAAHFSVPLASAFFQTRLYNAEATGVWKWATVQPVGIVLLVVYLAVIIAMLSLHFRFRRKPTGLKWDPVSLADVLVLLRGARGLATARNSMNTSVNDQNRASIGYWEDPSYPGAIFHGIGAMGPEGEQYPGHGQVHNASTFESWASKPRTRKSRKPRPSYLTSSNLLLYGVLAAAILTAFLAASYVHNALMTGFAPLLPSTTFVIPTGFTSFSPSNFLYSFVPSLVGLIVPLLWEPIDTAVRYLAPYYTLQTAGAAGVAAEHSLLLSYSADNAPFVSAVRSRAHGHTVVTLSGLFAAFSWAVPVLGGGVFTAQYVQSEGGIVVRADPAGLTGLTVFVVVSALGWIVAWPIGHYLMRRGRDSNVVEAAAQAQAQADAERAARSPRIPRRSSTLVKAHPSTRSRSTNKRRSFFSFGSGKGRKNARPTSATVPIMGGATPRPETAEERDLEKGDPRLEPHPHPLMQQPLETPPPIHDPHSTDAYNRVRDTPDEVPGTPQSIPYGRVRSNTPPAADQHHEEHEHEHHAHHEHDNDDDDFDTLDLTSDGFHHFLRGADVRYLSGVAETVGPAVLGLRGFREPASRADLVGRLVGRGRGRWSWSGEEKRGSTARRSTVGDGAGAGAGADAAGVTRTSPEARRSGLARVDV